MRGKHKLALKHIHRFVQRLDEIIETLDNFKQIYLNMVFWLQHSREIWFSAAPL